MRNFLKAALGACAAFALSAVPALADPALWVVKANGSTVYLFGTVHILPPDMAWRSAKVDAALKESQELWLEVPIGVTADGTGAATMTPEQIKEAQTVVAPLAINTGAAYSGKLTPAESQQLAALLAGGPLPVAAVDRLRPWMVATLVSAAQAKQIGWTELGPDVKLDQAAVAAGKPVKGFETLGQQAHFFADMSPDDELAYLKQTLDEASEGKARLQKMGQLWLAGDDQAMTRLMVSEMKTKEPSVYQRLVVERNKRWVPQIETLLKTPGVRFVAVGDGHLLGPDGVPALLKADGYKVERVK